jgi:hypothetical protein
MANIRFAIEAAALSILDVMCRYPTERDIRLGVVAAFV